MIGYEWCLWSFHTIFSCQNVSLTGCRRINTERFSFCFLHTSDKNTSFYVETIRYDPRRRWIYLRRSAPYAERISEIMQKSESNGKIPTLKNGAFNRSRSSTLYEYVEPRNVTEFISSTSNSLPLIHV